MILVLPFNNYEVDDGEKLMFPRIANPLIQSPYMAGRVG